MALPFGFIVSGILAIKDIVGSLSGLKTDDEKFKKISEFINEQNKINTQHVEIEKQQEIMINQLNSRIKRLEIVVFSFIVLIAVFSLILFAKN